MAVSISQFPTDYTTSDNPLPFVFSSTQTAQANFSFIVETYFNAALVSVDRVFPEVNDYAHIDVSPIVKNLFNTPTILNTLWGESGLYGEVNIKIIENYGTPPVNQADLTSTIIPVVKGCLSDRDWATYNPTDYMVSGLGAKFMTALNDFPSNVKVYKQRDVPFVLQAIQQGNPESITITLKNSSVGVINSYTENQTFYVPQVVITDSILLGLSGFSALDVAETEWIDIEIGGAIFTVYLYDADCDDDPSTLQWINQFGSWDSFIFRHNVERKGEVSERTYTKKFGTWDSTTYTYDLNNAGNIRVGTQQIDKLTIYTDWITQVEQNYLTTLYKSPRYFLYYDGDTYNVRVTSNQFTFKKARFEDEISEAVELDIVNNHNGLSL